MTGPTDTVETIAYDPETETHRLAYDTTATPPSLAVAVALESITGREHTDPLYDAIDPDALDVVLTAPGGDGTADHRSIGFTASGFRITVSSRGHLEVRPAPDGGRREGSD